VEKWSKNQIQKFLIRVHSCGFVAKKGSAHNYAHDAAFLQPDKPSGLSAECQVLIAKLLI
jgi:hypothetical protein